MEINKLKRAVSMADYCFRRFYLSWKGLISRSVGRIIFPFLLIKNLQTFTCSPSYYPDFPRKQKFQIFLDQLRFIIRKGEINRYYFLYGLDRVGSDENDYISWFESVSRRNYKNRFFNHKPTDYDPYDHICLLRDKIMFEAICSRFHIPTPRNIGRVLNGTLILFDGMRAMPVYDLANMKIDSFCKRNVGHGGGMEGDVFRLLVSREGVFWNGKKISKEELANRLSSGEFVLQERISNQHAFIAALHPASVNTVRVISVMDAGNVRVIGALMRLGANGRHADNWSSGGVIVGIDLESGVLRDYGFFKQPYGLRVTQHPDTGIKFAGFEVPMWSNIVNLVTSLHGLLHGLHSVGWDICLTEEGPVVIEGNDNWETVFLQLYGGARSVFDRYFV